MFLHTTTTSTLCTQVPTCVMVLSICANTDINYSSTRSTTSSGSWIAYRPGYLPTVGRRYPTYLLVSCWCQSVRSLAWLAACLSDVSAASREIATLLVQNTDTDIGTNASTKTNTRSQQDNDTPTDERTASTAPVSELFELP